MYVNRDIHSGCYVYNKDDAKNPTLDHAHKKRRTLRTSLKFAKMPYFTGIRR
ncbi:hypothetical protein SAMN06265375_103370 [Muriicola jejuensis]|nr:hypothetical protein SAMN06265375_103370 [Muriicola jejuensis]